MNWRFPEARKGMQVVMAGRLRIKILRCAILIFSSSGEAPENEGLTKGKGLSILYFIERSMKWCVSVFSSG